MTAVNVLGELLAGEGNPNGPEAENPSRNPQPFCQNSQGEVSMEARRSVRGVEEVTAQISLLAETVGAEQPSRSGVGAVGSAERSHL